MAEAVGSAGVVTREYRDPLQADEESARRRMGKTRQRFYSERTGELSAGDIARIGTALEASIAPYTAKAYGAAPARFAEWLANRPATGATVAAYVAHLLMEDGKAPATIKQAVAAWTSSGIYEGPALGDAWVPAGPWISRRWCTSDKYADGRSDGSMLCCLRPPSPDPPPSADPGSRAPRRGTEYRRSPGAGETGCPIQIGAARHRRKQPTRNRPAEEGASP